MKSSVLLVGASSGIGQAILNLLCDYNVTCSNEPKQDKTYDYLIWCGGHDYEVCVRKLLKVSASAKNIVVITSEHGRIPTGIEHAEYQCMKAAQKMAVKMIAKSGKPCVDVSPAFVIDSGKNKRIHRDADYRESCKRECVGCFPVHSSDVANAVLFAMQNITKITGSEIRVSSGWRV